MNFCKLGQYQTAIRSQVESYIGDEVSLKLQTYIRCGETINVLTKQKDPEYLVGPREALRSLGTLLLYVTDLASLRVQKNPEVMTLPLSEVASSETTRNATKAQPEALYLLLADNVTSYVKGDSDPSLSLWLIFCACQVLALRNGSTLNEVLEMNVNELIRAEGS